MDLQCATCGHTEYRSRHLSQAQAEEEKRQRAAVFRTLFLSPADKANLAISA